jgi:hypothetical protein
VVVSRTGVKNTLPRDTVLGSTSGSNTRKNKRIESRTMEREFLLISTMIKQSEKNIDSMKGERVKESGDFAIFRASVKLGRRVFL